MEELPILPRVVWTECIARYMTIPDIANAMLVSHDWFEVFVSDSVWIWQQKRMCAEFPHLIHLFENLPSPSSQQKHQRKALRFPYVGIRATIKHFLGGPSFAAVNRKCVCDAPFLGETEEILWRIVFHAMLCCQLSPAMRPNVVYYEQSQETWVMGPLLAYVVRRNYAILDMTNRNYAPSIFVKPEARWRAFLLQRDPPPGTMPLVPYPWFEDEDVYGGEWWKEDW